MSASPLQRGASKGVPQGGILQRRSTSVSMMQQQSHVSRVEPGYHTRSVYHVTKGTNAVLVGNRTISIHGEAHCSCTRTHTPTYKCTPAQLSLTHTHTHAHTRLHTQPSHTHTHTQRMRTMNIALRAIYTNTGWLRDCLAKAKCFVKQGSSKRPKTNGSKCYRFFCVCCRHEF